MEPDEETLTIIQRHIRQCALQSSESKASFRDVMLSLGKELDRDVVRELMPVIKQEIESMNSKSIEELRQDDEEDEEGLIENEYDELSSSFQKGLEGKDYISSLIAYGSYGKSNHIMGQSNLNFLLLLKDMDGAKQELVGTEIKQIIESIMNPLYEYLFDLIILFDQNVSSIENFRKRMGPGFTAIHAYSASQCEPLIGENPFKKLDLSADIKNSAKMILQDTLMQYKQSIADLKADPEPSPEDLAYLSSEAMIDFALGLIYYFMKETALEHITKPDIKEKYSEYFAKNKQFKPFISGIEHSFAYRLGVNKIADSEITDQEIIDQCEKIANEIEKLLAT
jgi:hypothetical protein